MIGRSPEFAIEVECSGESHVVKLVRGRLAFSHPHFRRDFEAEAVLASLGAPVSTCTKLLLAWRRCEGLDAEPDPVPRLVEQAASGGPLANLFRFPSVKTPLPEPLRRARLLTLADTYARRMHHRPPADSVASDWDYAFLIEQMCERSVRVGAATAGVVLLSVSVDIGTPACELVDEGQGERSALVTVPRYWPRRVWVPGFELLTGRTVLDRQGARVTVIEWCDEGPQVTVLTA